VNQHGGARRGAGRPRSPEKKQREVNRLNEKLADAFPQGIAVVSEVFVELMKSAVEKALGNVETECPKCHETIFSPFPDKNMLQFLINKMFQVNDVADSDDVTALRKIQLDILVELGKKKE
jgi:hypothetical protein